MKKVSLFDSAVFLFVRRHWLTVAFLLGFVTDYLLLNRVDDKVDSLVLFFYVILATVSLLLFYVGVAEKAPVRLVNLFNRLMPLLMQYSFGGLLSGMLIFYGRSGDLLVSAPFMILIVGIILLNELVKKRSDRLLYNLTVYFIGVISYLVLMVPVWLGEMGDLIFISSGLLALLVVFLVMKVLSFIIPHFLVLEKRMIIFAIGGFYVLFNTFYFFNIIPPIPLSLTELSIYQSVTKTVQNEYQLVREKKDWRDYLPLIKVFHPLSGQGAYCFASVYAPTSLTTNIVHRWEYLDNDGVWKEYFTKSYQIAGDNTTGYRGYTMIENVHDGRWRCSVETVRGQVLGRRTFKIDTSVLPDSLVTVVE